MIKFVYSLDEQTLRDIKSEMEADKKRLKINDYEYIDGIFKVFSGAKMVNKRFLVTDYILQFKATLNNAFLSIATRKKVNASVFLHEAPLHYFIGRVKNKIAFDIYEGYDEKMKKQISLFIVNQSEFANALIDANHALEKEIKIKYSYLMDIDKIRRYIEAMQDANSALKKYS